MNVVELLDLERPISDMEEGKCHIAYRQSGHSSLQCKSSIIKIVRWQRTHFK